MWDDKKWNTNVMSKRDERFDFWMETHFISSFAVSADRTPPPPFYVTNHSS